MWEETGTNLKQWLKHANFRPVTSPELPVIQERRNLVTPKFSKNRIRFCGCSIANIYVVSWIMIAN